MVKDKRKKTLNEIKTFHQRYKTMKEIDEAKKSIQNSKRLIKKKRASIPIFRFRFLQ